LLGLFLFFSSSSEERRDGGQVEGERERVPPNGGEEASKPGASVYDEVFLAAKPAFSVFSEEARGFVPQRVFFSIWEEFDSILAGRRVFTNRA